MKVLCVHHKGGVGKTTTAIHITGVFLNMGNKVLLIDGDSQAHSFKFFSEGLAPKAGGETFTTQEDKLTVISESDKSNPDRLAKTLGKLAKNKKFTHTVIDVSPDLTSISKFLFEVTPDLVLLGVKQDDIGSFVSLNDMLIALEQARPIIGSIRVKIVPIGASKSDFQQFIDNHFTNYEILDPVDWLPMKAGNAVFINYDYLWTEPDCEHLWDYYKKVVME
ncbi:ParA family protein [Cronbergia sp. UHCC 0137]|uniref:ParA family protein n=1 Tax=Cronbergia sp. UHCC 0137 TaxID=3110239 RepID=UPI002B20DA71|nr:ParA family protein [Cronbergia sp. UHCC 0137]MEA5617852.1 ParA family protein [Cronbergia sp. UHCC 0137]